LRPVSLASEGNTPGQLAALMELVNISQVLFGSDSPQ
jgi:hypothetical protein